MIASLLRSMRVQLKVEEKGKGPWFDVLAITGPFACATNDPFAGPTTHGHFLILNPEREPKLHWLVPAQIEEVEYELTSWPTAGGL